MLINLSKLFINKDSFLSAILQRYAGSLSIQLSGFIVSLIVSKILGPTLLGTWAIIHIIINYYSYSNLGATNALTRNLGIALGKKDKIGEKMVIGSAHALQFTLPLLITILLLISSFFFDDQYTWLLPVSGLIGFFSLYEIFLSRILNAEEQHKKLAKVAGVKSMLSVIVIIPMVYVWSLQGRVISALIIAITLIIYTYNLIGRKIGFVWEFSTIIDLVKIGFPIAAIGFLQSSMFVSDRVIAGLLLGSRELGIYQFSFYLVFALVGIKQTISNVLYQRQNFIAGRDSGDLSNLYLLSRVSAIFTTNISSIMSGFILIIFSFFVHHFFIEYLESIEIAFVVIFSQVLGSISFLNSIGRHNQFLVISFFVLLFNILLSLVGGWMLGLIGIAYATLFSFIFYNLLLNYVNMRILKLSKFEILKFNIGIMISPLWCFILVKLYEHIMIKEFTDSFYHNSIYFLIGLITYSILIIPIIPF